MARIAVVTGANRGIGEAIARELAARGLHVIATSREGRLERTRGPEQDKAAAEPFQLDVTRPETIEALAERLSAGGFDVLVNNAGVALEGFNAEVARSTIDANFHGAMRTTDRLLPLMRAGGRVVMVSSGLGELACLSPALRERFEDPGLDRDALVSLVESFVRDVAVGTHANSGWPSSAYRVSKVGMNAFVRVLTRELASDARRILVNAANPGWVRTRMGGSSAPCSPEDGARTPVWLALLPDGGPTGGFFREECRVAW